MKNHLPRPIPWNRTGNVESPHLATRVPHIEAVGITRPVRIDGGNVAGNAVGHVGVVLSGVFPDQGSVKQIDHVNPSSHPIGTNR